MSKIIGITVGTPINPEKFNEGGGGAGFTLVQETGYSETAVMSQKATTEELRKISDMIGEEKIITGDEFTDYGVFISPTIYAADGEATLYLPKGLEAKVRNGNDYDVDSTNGDITVLVDFGERGYAYIEIYGGDFSKIPEVTITQRKNKLTDIEKQIGDIDTALDELHAYAQALISGGVAE